MTDRNRKEEARELRRQGWSINRIAEEVGAAKSSVSKWTRDIKITEAQKEAMYQREEVKEAQLKGSQANYIKHHNLRLGYQEEGRRKAREGDMLHSWGCMLYWAEGCKSRYEIRFVNSDADMMILFIKFARECLEIPEEKIKIRVTAYLSDDTSEKDITDFWLEKLSLEPECMRENRFNLQPKSSQQKGRKLKYGVCEISISSVEHMQHIYGAIQEYAGIDRPEWVDL